VVAIVNINEQLDKDKPVKIVIIDDYQGAFRGLDCFTKLSEQEVTVHHESARNDAELVAQLRDAEAVILTMQRTPITRTVLSQLPNLKMISQTGRNTGHIDVPACTEKGVVISAGGSSSPNATVELAWGLILSTLRHIPQEVYALKNGSWQTTLGTGLFGKTLGIYAYGRIGAIMAQLGRAFGMNVICWGRESSLARARDAGFDVAPHREAFFEIADVVTLHIQLNKETRGIITKDDLGRMKADSLIVNTSRAPIIADGALVEALKRGRPGRAAIDVYEHEPVLGADHPLLALDNALCTPHLGYVEKGTYEALFTVAIDQVLAFEAGSPINVINREVLEGL
jgi:D-3-phosphoglycerate dehydrogenase